MDESISQLLPPSLIGPIGRDPAGWSKLEQRAVYGCVMAWLSCATQNAVRAATAKFLLEVAIVGEAEMVALPSGDKARRSRLSRLVKVCRTYVSENESRLLKAHPVSTYRKSIVWVEGKKEGLDKDFRQVMSVGEIVLQLICKSGAAGHPKARNIKEAREGLRSVPGHDLYRKDDEVLYAFKWYGWISHLCAAYRLFIQYHKLGPVELKHHTTLRKNVGELLLLSSLIAERLEAVPIKKKSFREYYKLLPVGDVEFSQSVRSACITKYSELVDFKVPDLGT